MFHSQNQLSSTSTVSLDRLLHPVFILAVIGFTSHQVCQKFLGVHIKWIDNYLDPLVCMPIVLTMLTLQKQYFLKQNKADLSYIEIILATGIFMLFSEIIFPTMSSRFTADPLDLLAFAVGALIFVRFMR